MTKRQGTNSDNGFILKKKKKRLGYTVYYYAGSEYKVKERDFFSNLDMY